MNNILDEPLEEKEKPEKYTLLAWNNLKTTLSLTLGVIILSYANTLMWDINDFGVVTGLAIIIMSILIMTFGFISFVYCMRSILYKEKDNLKNGLHFHSIVFHALSY